MNARAQPLLVGYPFQQHRQLVPFFVAESRAQCLLMFARDLSDSPEDVSPLARQMKSVAPAIARMIASLQQAAFLEVVDQRHEPAGRDAELGSERLLTDPFLGLNDSKNSRIRRHEPQWQKPLGKPDRSMAANLRQEKGGRGGASHRLRSWR